jgi:hypothetical protein
MSHPPLATAARNAEFPMMHPLIDNVSVCAASFVPQPQPRLSPTVWLFHSRPVQSGPLRHPPRQLPKRRWPRTNWAKLKTQVVIARDTVVSLRHGQVHKAEAQGRAGAMVIGWPGRRPGLAWLYVCIIDRFNNCL